MIVGIVGVPPWEMMQDYMRRGATIIDLDEPVDGLSVRDIYLPSTFCQVLKRVVSNIFSLYETGRLDMVLATVGECKCDGMRNIARYLKATTDIPIETVKNDSMRGAGHPVCTSAIPPARKMELIVGSVFSPLPDDVDTAPCEPLCGFWGVPPADFSIMDLFPARTHIYGWTRCMENKTPADLELECHVDPDVPTVFFAQAFCQKNALAYNLARKHGGLFVEVDKRLTRSTRAKIEAFLQFNITGGIMNGGAHK